MFPYSNPHLLVVLCALLFGLDDDALQLVEAALHVGEAHACLLLLAPDALQLLLAQLLCDAWALLPLLDALGQNLVDAAEPRTQHNKQTNKQTINQTN